MRVRREQVALVVKEWLTEIFGEGSDIVREFSLDDFELSSFEQISGAEIVNLVRSALLRRAGERVICLRCGEALQARVMRTGVHREHCPWNYYLECPSCGYQNNLAKLLRLGCSCNGREPLHGAVCRAKHAVTGRCVP